MSLQMLSVPTSPLPSCVTRMATPVLEVDDKDDSDARQEFRARIDDWKRWQRQKTSPWQTVPTKHPRVERLIRVVDREGPCVQICDIKKPDPQVSQSPKLGTPRLLLPDPSPCPMLEADPDEGFCDSNDHIPRMTVSIEELCEQAGFSEFCQRRGLKYRRASQAVAPRARVFKSAPRQRRRKTAPTVESDSRSAPNDGYASRP